MIWLRGKIRKLEETKLGIFLFCISILLGILLSHGIKSYYWSDMGILDTTYLNRIKEYDMEYSKFFQYILSHNFRNFLFFLILMGTGIGIPYIFVCLIYNGIKWGFFFSVFIMKFHAKGILLIFGYLFPQCLIYIPFSILCLNYGFWICKNRKNNKNRIERINVEKYLKHLVLILCLSLILMLGGLVETYIGSYILKKIILQFI